MAKHRRVHPLAPRRGRLARATMLAVGGLALGCVTMDPRALVAKEAKPAKVRSISAGDKQKGAEYHPQLLAEFGGPYEGPSAAYVTRIGQRIATQSGLSNTQGDFTVTLLNSPVENAFAIPGGYVYMTRQLFALANDEAEVAGVMGHEVGHVAARHSRGRSRASAVSTGLAVLAGVLTGSSQVMQATGQFAQLITLKYSRGQETQADDLAVTYLSRAGYDPLAASTMLASLAAATTLEARTQNRENEAMPQWASTHPDPGARVTRAAAKANATGPKGGARNRDAYLAAVQGVRYGDDPKEGIVEGQSFRHPVLRIAFTAPNGFVLANGSDAVSIIGNGGQAEMSGVAYSGDMTDYVNRAFAAFSRGQAQVTSGVRTGEVNGMRTAWATERANTDDGPIDVTVYAFEVSAREAYHFAMMTPAGSGVGPFTSMIQSVRRLSAAEAARIKGRHVEVVTVGRKDTVATLAQRMAYGDYQQERFRVLNALAADASVTPGQKVKIVVYDK